MFKTLSLAACAAAVALLSACASDPTLNREAKVELTPMAKPAPVTSLPHIAGDAKVINELVSMDGDLVTYKQIGGNNDGCSWVEKDPFGPSLSWESCGETNGTQEYTKEGDIWPLEVGKTESYAVKGTNGTDSWQTTRRCEVKSTVMVVLGEKQVPTYEVICTDKWNTRTWYMSPELGQAVKYKRYNNSRGVVANTVAVLEEGS